jgi:hypothetical protein
MSSILPEHLQKAAAVAPIQEWVGRPLERQTMRSVQAGTGDGGKKNASRLEEVAQQRVALSSTHRVELAEWLQRFATYGVAIDDYNCQKLAMVSGSSFRTLKDILIDELPRFPKMDAQPKSFHASR